MKHQMTSKEKIEKKYEVTHKDRREVILLGVFASLILSHAIMWHRDMISCSDFFLCSLMYFIIYVLTTTLEFDTDDKPINSK